MPAISRDQVAATVGVQDADRHDLQAPAQTGDAAVVVAARADDAGHVRPVAVLVLSGALPVHHVPAVAVVDHAVAVVVAPVVRVRGVLPQVLLQVGMVGLHPGVEHRHLRATRPFGPGSGRVDVVVVLLLDGVLLADAGVVGVLGDGDGTVVFHALHAIAGAQSRPQLLEAGALAGRDGKRPHQAQSQRQAAARITDDPFPARLVGVLPELDEQSRDRRRLSARLREPILPELDACRGRRGHPGSNDRDDAEHENSPSLRDRGSVNNPSCARRSHQVNSFQQSEAAAYSDDPPPSTVPTPRSMGSCAPPLPSKEARCRPLGPLSAAGSPERRRRGRGRPPGRASAGRFRAASRR